MDDFQKEITVTYEIMRTSREDTAPCAEEVTRYNLSSLSEIAHAYRMLCNSLGEFRLADFFSNEVDRLHTKVMGMY